MHYIHGNIYTCLTFGPILCSSPSIKELHELTANVCSADKERN